MFIHIAPRMYATEPCVLLDLTIKEFDFRLSGETDLSVCQVYRNRTYLVACRRDPEWGAEGILLNTSLQVPEFTVVTRWAVADKHIAVHQVRYVLPAGYDDQQDMLHSNTPRMLVKPLPYDPRAEELNRLNGATVDACNEEGYLIERHEVVELIKFPRNRYGAVQRAKRWPLEKDTFDLSVRPT